MHGFMRFNSRARPHLAGVALLLVLLWLQATHGQETIVVVPRADPADEFSGVELVCPYGEAGVDQVDVQGGTDLSTLQNDWASPEEKTYLLTGSTYTVSSPISIQAGATICFIGTGAAAATVTVKGNGPYGWQGKNSQGSGVLGLKNMVLVGAPEYDGGAVSIGLAGDDSGYPALYAEGVAVRAFKKSAVLCFNGGVAMADSTFNGNGGPGVLAGGAIAATPQQSPLQSCSLELVDTTFEANSAQYGGAIAATGQGFTAVRVHGSTRFTDNIATTLGGAVYLQKDNVVGSFTTLSIGGNLCAQGNFAPTGALAALDGEVKLNFYYMEASAQTSNQGGTDSDIALKGSNAEIKCTSNGAWPSTPATEFSDYTVVGDVCACNDAFVSGASTTCGWCGATGWDTNTCSCRAPECTEGDCCDITTQTFKPRGTLCNSAYAHVWYTDDPDWIPEGCPGVFNSYGREKSWARACAGTCASGACVLTNDNLDACFAC